MRMRTAASRTGKLMSSENALNQHTKIKHPEFWETVKGKSTEGLNRSKKEESVELELAKREEEEKELIGFELDSSILRKESCKSDILGDQNIIDFGNNI